MRHQRCRQLYDLHINSLIYTLFLFQLISFIKYFYVSLGNDFLLVCGGHLVAEALDNCPVFPLPLNPALSKNRTRSGRQAGLRMSPPEHARTDGRTTRKHNAPGSRLYRVGQKQ